MIELTGARSPPTYLVPRYIPEITVQVKGFLTWAEMFRGLSWFALAIFVLLVAESSPAAAVGSTATCHVRSGKRCVLTCIANATTALYWCRTTTMEIRLAGENALQATPDPDWCGNRSRTLARVTQKSGRVKIEPYDLGGWRVTGQVFENDGLYSSVTKDSLGPEDVGIYICKNEDRITVKHINVKLISAPGARPATASPAGDSDSQHQSIGSGTVTGIILLLIVLAVFVFLGYRLGWWVRVVEAIRRCHLRRGRGSVATIFRR